MPKTIHCMSNYFSSFKFHPFQAVNETEALKHKESDRHLFSSEEAMETIATEEYKNISRTSNRISLTCRLVPKVHKNLFKF